MKIKPTLNRVAVRPDEVQTISSGGIHLPDSPEKVATQGVIVAVGPGSYNMDGSVRDMGLKVGDKVIFFDNYETSTGIDGVVICDEEDIRAVVE